MKTTQFLPDTLGMQTWEKEFCISEAWLSFQAYCIASLATEYILNRGGK